MDKSKFVLIPLSLWENRFKSYFEPTTTKEKSTAQVYLKLGGSLTPKTDRKSMVFEPKYKVSKVAPQSPQKSSLPNFEETLENKYKNNSSAKKILKKLTTNDSIKFSINKTIIVDNIDTEIDVEDFILNLTRKKVEFDPRFTIVLNVLDLDPSTVQNSKAFNDDNAGWVYYAF